jgi:hypothetical protein
MLPSLSFYPDLPSTRFVSQVSHTFQLFRRPNRPAVRIKVSKKFFKENSNHKININATPPLLNWQTACVLHYHFNITVSSFGSVPETPHQMLRSSCCLRNWSTPRRAESCSIHAGFALLPWCRTNLSLACTLAVDFMELYSP